jgi:hypothetical protein
LGQKAVLLFSSTGSLPKVERSLGESMTLTGQLKGMLDSYLDKYPNVSLNALALKSGVGATTLRRLKSESIKGDPAPHTVLALVSALSNEKRLSVLVEKYEGPLGDLLKTSFGPYVETKIDHSFKADLNSYLRDSTSYFVYKLCANRAGTNRDTIELNYGKVGLDRLSTLLKNGLVEEDQGRFFAKEKNFSLDVSIALDHLPQLASHFKLEEVSAGKNLFYTMSESLNSEGIEKIKAAQKEAVKKIIDIMNSPFYEGDVPYFSLHMCDSQTMPEKPEVYQ